MLTVTSLEGWAGFQMGITPRALPLSQVGSALLWPPQELGFDWRSPAHSPPLLPPAIRQSCCPVCFKDGLFRLVPAEQFRAVPCRGAHRWQPLATGPQGTSEKWTWARDLPCLPSMSPLIGQPGYQTLAGHTGMAEMLDMHSGLTSEMVIFDFF